MKFAVRSQANDRSAAGWPMGGIGRRSLFALASCFLLGGVAWGEEVQLRGGGRLSGKVSRVDSGKAPYAVIEVDPGIKVAIPENQLASLTEPEALAEYRRRAAETPQEAEAQYELAAWCQRSSLRAQARHHLQRVIRIDPSHQRARDALGYVSYDGKWVREADLQKARGLVRINGKYRMPAEYLLTEAKESGEKRSKVWVRDIDRLKKQVARGGDRAAEAQAELAAIDDPLAAMAIGKELVEGVGQSRDLRLFWIDKLAQLNSPAGLGPLLRVGLMEADPVVREKSLQTLNQLAPQAAKVFYVSRLSDNDNAVVRRAAEALSFFPDPELMLPLINALVTTHTKVIPADQSTSVGFNSAGGGGLTTGGQAQKLVTRIENPPVLEALQQLEPGANYGFDQRLWRMHLASKLSGYRGDMRRDE